MHLFDYLDSGNGYKVRLLLAQLGLDYRWTELDIDAGETREPKFLKRNPNGRIPTLELDDGTNLAESNAILWYLAEGTSFLPVDRLGRAQGHRPEGDGHPHQHCFHGVILNWSPWPETAPIASRNGVSRLGSSGTRRSVTLRK